MFKFLTAIMLVFSLVFLQAGCGTKTYRALQQLEDIKDELRIHNRNIAQVTNKFHTERKISDELHGRVIRLASQASEALDRADAAVKAAKLAGEKLKEKTANETDAEKAQKRSAFKGALDSAERFVDIELWKAFYAVAEAVFNVPPEFGEKISPIVTAIKLAFATIRSLLADIHADPYIKGIYGQQEVRYAE